MLLDTAVFSSNTPKPNVVATVAAAVTRPRPVLAQAHAIEKIYATLLEQGTTESRHEKLFPFAEFNDLMGLSEHRRAQAAEDDAGD